MSAHPEEAPWWAPLEARRRVRGVERSPMDVNGRWCRDVGDATGEGDEPERRVDPERRRSRAVRIARHGTFSCNGPTTRHDERGPLPTSHQIVEMGMRRHSATTTPAPAPRRRSS